MGLDNIIACTYTDPFRRYINHPVLMSEKPFLAYNSQQYCSFKEQFEGKLCNVPVYIMQSDSNFYVRIYLAH